MKRILCITLLLLASCAPKITPDQYKLRELMANRTITCTQGDDCDDKWSRAVQWVTNHSQVGIKTISDNLITTNMVSDGGKPADKYPEFTVVRYRLNKHSYRIDFTSYCDHGFVCGNNALTYRAEFVTAVIGLPPGVKQTGPNAYVVKQSVLDAAAKQ